jgi:NADH-quinone oxidoreductase subunit L
MFPLHIWLPDAMEGPTPVSALIHAATMVVAGVFLVARLFPIFVTDPAVQQLVAYVGGVSALLAAICACAQSDIKRVLAFSTISQIGFMMLALGVSGKSGEDSLGYTAAMFHLFTHACFKSLLFLCAGAIIHVVHSNDMRDMGGLAKKLPFTHICFLIGCLAIAGFPGFSGFFSKEEILLAVFASHKLLYGLALFTTALTAFYMFRLYFSVFFNQPARSLQTALPAGFGASHPNPKQSLSMSFPLLVLALCAAVVGFIPFGHFVSADGKPLASSPDWAFSAWPIGLSLAAIWVAGALYFRSSDRPAKVAAMFGSVYQLAVQKFYFDQLYLFVTKKIMFNLVGRTAAWFDQHIVDGLMNLLARATGKLSQLIRGFQSGKLQDYAWFFFAGVAGLSILFIYLWK